MSGVHKYPTISFRVSDREREMIEAKILASGMQKKDYFVRSCIYKYIPNLDDLGLDDKKAILSDIYQIDLSDKDERFVEIQFHRIMKREIRDIEKDRSK